MIVGVLSVNQLLYVRDTVSRKWQKLNAKTVVLRLTTIRHQVPPIALLVRPVDQNFVYLRKSSPDRFLPEEECEASHIACLRKSEKIT